MMGLKPPNRYLLLLLCFNSLCCSAIESVNLVDFCGQTIRRDGMIVKSHQESKKYYFVTMGTDCHLTMQASSPKDKVQFYFRFFLVYSLLRVAPLSPAPLVQESSRSSAFLNSRLDPTSGVSPEDPCYAGSFLQFYDGRDRSSPALGPPLCGKSAPRPVLSTGNYLTLRLVTRGTQPRVDFVGDFTSFRLGFNQSECRSEPYFSCRNGKCIPVSLVCDDKDIDNCGDGSDLEENLTTSCKRQLSPTARPPQISTPTLSLVSLPTHVGGTCMNCSVTGSSLRRESVTASSPSSLLALYIILGVVAGGLVLCWCCWSPAWFLWRLSVCRFLPCCKSTCATCAFFPCNRANAKEQRVSKVSPHMPVSRSPPDPAASAGDNPC
ncbi:low-density lipoprotein receptor class A domain-containing protein 2 [Poeciliopsis prolifica]|uniref:low-density lipoprotein receptor class A domain-containing protein 2 n=1 Tax=Poeciliopsis prolifica TaxID=188132 RepID=UPI002412F12F|nr:low-density lipoprotein receptor class A domain-containing protein 2 [Poeciliopsis prolifica]